MIEVEHLVKRYGAHTAVDDLTFTLEPGRIYGFLGPNGAGKSTTMNVMTGYIAADGGRVVIDGHDILRNPIAAKACIGYLPEVPPLYTDMTVREFLLFAAQLKLVPRRERKEKVEMLLERFSLLDVSGRLIRNLSKGYRQRVGLAQALLGNPKVLILDEPMVGLDPKQIIEMRELIRELSGEHTIILSSHILSEVSAVCDHILILSRGKLAASGSPEELQRMMRGGTELAVTVIGAQGQAEAVLAQMEEISQYSFETGSEEGSIVVRIETKEDADIRKSLSVALAGAGIPILSMNRAEKSLEDIFLELTNAELESENADETEEAKANGTESETDTEIETEGGESDDSDL
ncbi:MAG: ABC transporter ATP-binding protein [Bacteroidales bacterium]|nr:ABC transporter ATP-binding protein [Bacteroidales bacterium]MCM1416353.1 ABC transporter ATP-binding protein [bacterium]MCM1423572.1 ABC transporter ATP-binding protein [bacterium]